MSYIEATDTSQRKTGQIKLHGPSGFAGMRKAGALVAQCLDELTDIVKPGVPTSRIDDFVRDFAFDHGAYPATLMYRGYRYSTCTSINHVVCHGMPGEGVVLKPGMFFTIEPMINLGKPHVKILSDGWTAVTRDRSLSAQFEHSVGVTANGVEIFTLSQRHAEKPPAAA